MVTLGNTLSSGKFIFTTTAAKAATVGSVGVRETVGRGSGWARCGGINSGVGISGDMLVGPIGYAPRVLASAAIDGAWLLDCCRRGVGKGSVEEIGEANGVVRRKSEELVVVGLVVAAARQGGPAPTQL